MRWLMISILASSCAAATVKPQPSSMETAQYELIEAGQPAREDGLFLTIPAARDVLKAQRMKEIDMQEQLAQTQLERDDGAKALKLDAFCQRWCFPLGVLAGSLVGGGFGIWAASKK